MDESEAARQAARDLRATWYSEHPGDDGWHPPLEAIVASRGLEIARFSPQDTPNTLGFLDANDPLIWLAAGLPPPVERFTLAHELGHHVLHRGADPCAATDLSQLAVLQPDEAYSMRSQREHEANAFAAELLAPLARVRATFLGAAGEAPLTPAVIAQLAGVTPESILRQIIQLLLAPYDTQASAEIQPSSTPPPLDPSQAAAVGVQAPALIVAGPGTGKTSTLVGRVHWLVEQGVAPEQILALTFGRKAAGEMHERIAAALGAERALPTVATFHRFGIDVLRRYGHLVGLRPEFRLVDEIGGFFLLRDIASTLPLDHYLALANPTSHFPTLLQAIARAKDDLVDPAQYAALAQEQEQVATTPAEYEAAARAEEVAAVYACYQGEMARRSDADYGDLVMALVRLLREHGQVRATLRQAYTHILVDEFQDINRANGVLLQLLAGPDGNLWAVGDANQAIYRFRGASPANIARFHEDYPGAHIVALEHNYRSRPAIVAAANRFAARELRDQGAPLTELHAVRPDLPQAIRLGEAPDGATEIAAIVADIAARHAAGMPLTACAVLCRTRSQTRQVAEALTAADIAAEARTALFDDESIKDLLGIPQLLAGETWGLLRAARVPDHPLSAAAVRTILAALSATDGRFRDVAPTILASGDLAPADHASLSHIQDLLSSLRQMPHIQDALAMYCCTATAIGRRALVAPGQASHLAELLLLAGRFDAERFPAPSEAPEARWGEFIAYLRAVRPLAREGPSAASTADRVAVLTVHGAKGLEWPIVYLPFLAARRFPSQRRPDLAPAPPGLAEDSAPTDDLARAHRIEEACLFYVALTRARDTLILSRAERYSEKQRSGPSPFLEDILVGSGIPAEPFSPATSVSAVAEDSVPDDALVAFLHDLGRGEAFTASELDAYDRCPRQYALRYGLGLASRPGSYVRLRRAVAAALRAAPEDGLDPQRAVDRFEQHWQASAGTAPSPRPDGATDPFAAIYLRHGRTAVARSVARLAERSSARTTDSPAPTQRDQGHDELTQAVQLALDDVAISLELDQVAAMPDAVAVRHRLGRRKRERADPDLRLFFLVMAQRGLAGDAAADTILDHHLSDGELVSVTLDAKDEAKWRARARAAIAGIRAGDYPTKPDPQRCGTCAFALICSM